MSICGQTTQWQCCHFPVWFCPTVGHWLFMPRSLFAMNCEVTCRSCSLLSQPLNAGAIHSSAASWDSHQMPSHEASYPSGLFLSLPVFPLYLLLRPPRPLPELLAQKPGWSRASPLLPSQTSPEQPALVPKSSKSSPAAWLSPTAIDSETTAPIHCGSCSWILSLLLLLPSIMHHLCPPPNHVEHQSHAPLHNRVPSTQLVIQAHLCHCCHHQQIW